MRWSPNQSSRYPKGQIRLIVLHSTEGNYEGAVDWLMDDEADASYHIIYAQDGRRKKLVPLSKQAWHVGTFWGRDRANAVSVGLGMERHGKKMGYPDKMLRKVCKDCASIIRHHPVESIVAHARLDPARRTDPVKFPWRRFWKILSEEIKKHG